MLVNSILVDRRSPRLSVAAVCLINKPNISSLLANVSEEKISVMVDLLMVDQCGETYLFHITM